MKNLSLEISNQHSKLRASDLVVSEIFRGLESSGKFPISGGELSIAFVDDATIAKVHGDFMDDPTPTDVITFPADPEMESAGEIVVSVDHAFERAKDFGEPFGRELALYLIHGWLHLAGYDDREEQDRKRMRAAEKEALALFNESSIFGNLVYIT